MRTAGRFLLLVLVLSTVTCGGSGGGGSSSPNPGGPPPVIITTPGPTLPMAFLGVAITPFTFTATGTAPINWTVTGGTLTSGLALSLSGVLSGTPTVLGTFNFIVTATDPYGFTSAPFAQIVVASITETEPNDTPATADAATLGASSRGTLDTDDVDYWSFAATAGQVVKVELFGVRRDFATWDANGNLPKVSVIGPNGTAFLDGPDYFNAGTAGWAWGAHDLDIPLFGIPTTGTYFIRLEPIVPGLAGGDYALRVSDVSPVSLQSETESNDDYTTANPITPGMIRGNRVDENDDYFSFTITEPTLVYFEMTVYRNGVFGIPSGAGPDDDYYDPRIDLLDIDGTSMLAANDNVFFSDCALHYRLATAGTYYLRVTESGAGTDGDADYFLTFTATAVGLATESEPNDDIVSGNATPIGYGDIISGTVESGFDDYDFYSFSGTAGDMVRLFFFDLGANQTASDFIDIYLMLDDSTYIQRAISYPGVNAMACVRAILPSTNTFYIRVTPQGGLTNYTLQLTLFKDAYFEQEGNDTPGTATTIPVSGRVAGVVDSATDIDYFTFSAEAGEVVTFSIYAGPGSQSNGFSSHSSYTTAFAALLPDLEVQNFSGTTLQATPYVGVNVSGESVTNGLATSELTFVAPSAGTFYVRVTASDAGGDPDHLYLLEKR